MRTVPKSLVSAAGGRYPKLMSVLSRGDGQDDIWGGSFVGASLQASLVAKVLATLFAAGASLAGLTVILPHPASANELGLLAIVAGAYLTAALLYIRAAELPAWTLQAALAWGSTLITGVAYYSGEAPSPLVFFYLWVFLYASYFFTHRQTALQIVYVGAAYGTLLAVTAPAGSIPTWWLVGMGTLLVGAMVIMVMRARVELLIARLYDAARTDPLTKLSNRRGFRELLDLELERARRSGTAMGVLVGDLDDFKDVNDRSGHHIGDLALQRVAGLLREGKRQLDGAARVGGEEFALIVPDTEPNDAFALSERLRLALTEEFAGDPTPLTISFGLSIYPEHGETAASLLHAADEALYAAKRGGRNRTVLHSPALRAELRAPSDIRDIQGERFVIAVLDMAEAVDLRFSGSARHSETVGRYAEMMARELGLPEWRISRIRLAGILHDIGKAGVPNSILHKPGPLTVEEYELIKGHPALGAQMIEHISLSDVREWVAMHHERPDGLGYPLGLSAAAIPLEAHIVAVADAYEAMTSDRPYRDSIGYDAALAELRHGAGTQFDAVVVVAFIAILEREAKGAGESFAASA
jgi:diguanylate cyclase (GGDEF)-like protein/putative nucleotidyltransferase with HDIG domain